MAEIDNLKEHYDKHLQEIKEQYNQEFDIRKTLETKANNITTISGTVAGLFFGLGQFLIGKLIEINYDYLFWIIFLLILGIAGNIVSIVYSILAWKEKRYCYVMNDKVRIRADENIGEKDENVRNVKNVPNIEFTSRNISAFEKDVVKLEEIINELEKQGEKADNPPTLKDGYLYCIHKNALINAKKAFNVTRSQYIFIASIIIIVLPLIVLLIHLPHTQPESKIILLK